MTAEASKRMQVLSSAMQDMIGARIKLMHAQESCADGDVSFGYIDRILDRIDDSIPEFFELMHIEFETIEEGKQ